MVFAFKGKSAWPLLDFYGVHAFDAIRTPPRERSARLTRFPRRCDAAWRNGSPDTARVLDASSEILPEETIVNTRAALKVFSARFLAALIAMETGTQSLWVRRLFDTRHHSGASGSLPSGWFL